MPVPKDKEAKYGTIIASQITLAKKKGMSKKKAVAYGESKAEQWLFDTESDKKK